MDADEAADSMRFWTGRHVLGDLSVCYRSAWESARPGERFMTFTPENPNSVNPDWPFRGIDHVLIRCGDSGGGKKTAPIRPHPHTPPSPGVLKTNEHAYSGPGQDRARRHCPARPAIARLLAVC